MPQEDIIYFDIAAVVVMTVLLLSFLMRRLTNRPATRVYFASMLLVFFTAIACLGGEIYDWLLGPFLLNQHLIEPQYFEAGRSALTLLFYLLRTFTAPAYLILIATVSDTTYRMYNSNLKRFLLWTPMLATALFVLTNPLHHLVYVYEGGTSQRGAGILVLYATAAYYAAFGIGWLFRWRAAFDDDEFSILMMLYPFMFIAVYIQYYFPFMRVDMFATAVSIMLISAFVVPPEKHVDTHMKAANLFAYREKCRHAFLTGQPLCLVFVEIVNIEQLRELVGTEEIQDIIGNVSHQLSETLAHDDVLYYLRNGLFCIIPRKPNPHYALETARRGHEEGKARSLKNPDQSRAVRMRSCVVRIPEDASNVETVRTFTRRFAHLVPDSQVTTYEELSQRKDFELEMSLTNIVDNAIEKRSFEVHYQPIYCMKDGKFRSAEALVRLNDPTFGWVSPGLFIPEAEQNGTIAAIGEILIEKICAFLGKVEFEKTGLKYVEVNLSVDQCMKPTLARELLETMQHYGVDSSRINFELTETSATYSQKLIEKNVHELAEAGLTFSLDDYGTGYSNVGRALDLPFSLVKLDKSLIDKLDDPAMHEVVSRTIAMMHSIGKEVLAEGIEAQEQVDLLRTMGIDYIQGYFFSKPLPESEFIAFLEQRNA